MPLEVDTLSLFDKCPPGSSHWDVLLKKISFQVLRGVNLSHQTKSVLMNPAPLGIAGLEWRGLDAGEQPGLGKNCQSKNLGREQSGTGNAERYWECEMHLCLTV